MARKKHLSLWDRFKNLSAWLVIAFGVYYYFIGQHKAEETKQKKEQVARSLVPELSDEEKEEKEFKDWANSYFAGENAIKLAYIEAKDREHYPGTFRKSIGGTSATLVRDATYSISISYRVTDERTGKARVLRTAVTTATYNKDKSITFDNWVVYQAK